jgi:hypothetical protein
MNRRPYREAQSLQDRLSDEFHRNRPVDRMRNADLSRFARQSPIDDQAGDGGKQRARDMASQTVDEMADKSAKSTDQASRKRRLIEGPGESREVRLDSAKAIEQFTIAEIAFGKTRPSETARIC